MSKAKADQERIHDMVQDVIAAIGADLETGSHHLNNAAAERFAKQHPRLCETINKLAEHVQSWGPE